MNESALGIFLTLLAQTPAPLPGARDVPDEERPPLNAALGGPGLDIATADGRYRALKPLELAVRYYAFVDPDTSRPGDLRKEMTFGVNWFFARHDNKLTFDVSRLSLERVESPPLDNSCVRLQWDISFLSPSAGRRQRGLRVQPPHPPRR